jgi:putative Mn2+ efflux pump MntP
MDAFAVAAVMGCSIKRFNVGHAFALAFAFGFFQFLMPLMGWLGGVGFRTLVFKYDHWIAFGLLSAVGLKMIYEALPLKKAKEAKDVVLTFQLLLILAIATSIDALAVGFSLSLLKVSIVFPAMLIGIITFFVSIAGCGLGNKFGSIFEHKLEIIGGLILLGIGIKILLQHLLAA